MKKLIFTLILSFSSLPCEVSRADEQDASQLPSEELDAPVQTIRVPISDLEKLPVLATIDLEQFPSTFDVELPKSYVGDDLTGLIRLNNRGDADVKIERVKTSCGCAVAHSEKRELEVGDATPLLVKFAFRINGMFRNSILISTNFGQVMIRVSTSVVDRIAINQLSYGIAEGVNSIPIVADINDPVLLGEQLAVTPSTGAIKLIDWQDPLRPSRLRYDLLFDKNTSFPAMVSLTFASSGKPVSLLQIRVDRPGAINVSPRHVYAKRSSDSETLHFRLILSGATADLEARNSGIIDFLEGANDEIICSRSIDYTVKKLNQVVILDVAQKYDDEIRALSLVGQPSRLKINGIELKFDLTIR